MALKSKIHILIGFIYFFAGPYLITSCITPTIGPSQAAGSTVSQGPRSCPVTRAKSCSWGRSRPTTPTDLRPSRIPLFKQAVTQTFRSGLKFMQSSWYFPLNECMVISGSRILDFNIKAKLLCDLFFRKNSPVVVIKFINKNKSYIQ